MRLGAVAALALLACGTPASGGAHQSQVPAGRIVFESGNLRPSDGVHVVNANGTGQRQLAAPIYVGPSVLDAARPEPSPQGDRIVFVRHRFANVPPGTTRRISTIVVVSLQAERPPRRLGRGDFPSWSPDGRRIAFQRLGALHVVGADGSGLRRLARVDRRSFRHFAPQGDRVDLAPAWSPDGRRLAFARSGEIWVARVDGAAVRRLTASSVADAAPVWSPDGSHVGWVCGRDVCTMRADGGAERRLTELGDSTAILARWSPGRSNAGLAFVVAGPGLYRYSLYLTPAGGSRPRLVLEYDRTGYPDFAWSPDGRLIVLSFSRLVDGPPREYRQQVAVVSVDAGTVRPVTSTSGWHPRWTR